MEKNQRVKQQTSKASEAQTTARERRLQVQAKQRWTSLVAFMASHPWLVWSGVITFIIASTAISLLSLTYAGRPEQSETETETGTETELEPFIAQQPSPADSTKDNSISVWMLVSIALLCASGSLVMFRHLNSPAPSSKRRSRRVGKRPNPNPSPGRTTGTPPRKQEPKQAARSHPPVAKPEPVAKRYVKPEPVARKPVMPVAARNQPVAKPVSMLSRTQPVPRTVIPVPRRPQPLARSTMPVPRRPQPLAKPPSTPLRPQPVAQPAISLPRRPQSLTQPAISLPRRPQSLAQPAQPGMSIPRRPQPLITVLSPEARLPLDRGEQSLADMMDIRKQRPLGSMLRNP